MALKLTAVTFDAADPSAVAAFWAGLLGREPVPDHGGVLLPGDSTQVGLHFVQADSRKVGPNRLHLHITGAISDDQQATASRAVDLGGRHIDVGQLPEENHVVLADPDDNEFCIMEVATGFLEGCGLLGEVTCDGTRDIGIFWSEALDWPLVWDHDGETAIQSPLGGTKVSWGGPPVAPKDGRNRQRLLLTAENPETEASRLVGMGADVLRGAADHLELSDPDGNEFELRPEGRS